MKSTGIIRRIDDLGRVVIPKEIRRTMRIQEGDPLEIFVQDGYVVYKKYSPIGALSDFAQDYAEVLSRNIDFGIVITDTDTAIAVSGIPKKPIIGADLSGILDTIRHHKQPTTQPITIIDEYIARIVYPIISEGDLVGAIMVITTKDGEQAFSDITAISTAAQFLGKQMECK